MKHKLVTQKSIRGIVALLLAGASLASTVTAANITKADNSDNLNLTTSWSGGVVPGTGDVAQWDSTLATLSNTTNILGANASWSGIKILNPVGAITITTNSGGNTLTLGAAGIDMSSATADLTLSNNVTLPDYTVQTWSVPSGRTLSLGGAFTRTGGACLSFNANGVINMAAGTASSVLGYGLYGGTDVAAWDASKNISAVNSVIGYITNPNSGIPSTQYVDVTTGNSGASDDMYLNTSIWYPRVIRLNTPQPNRNYWSLNAYKGQFSLNSGVNTYLMTTNVGACDVYFNASGGGQTIRFGQSSGIGSELVLDQENTAGSMYFAGNISQKSALAGNMITKRGAGRVVFNAALGYSGPTRILKGEFMLNSTSLSSSIFTVNSGATLSGIGNVTGVVTNNGTIWAGTNGLGGLTVGALTLNAGSALKFYSATVPTTNTTALLNITNTVAVNGAVSVSAISGGMAVGQYPLVKAPVAFTAPQFANFNLAVLPPHVNGYLSNNTANASIDLVVTSVNLPLSWAVGNGNWDINTSSNWKDALGAATTYQELNGLGDSVLFEDTLSGSSPITVTANTTVSPVSVTVSNITKTYTISGSGAIAGPGSLTKKGSGSLTLATANTFTGGINLNGGTTIFSALNNLGAGPISFGGGTLQYSGNSDDISVRTVTIGAGGATIDVGSSVVTYNAGIGNGGAGGLTKNGAGTLSLNSTNTYGGNTVINAGTLFLNGGTAISNSPAIVVNSGATLDVTYIGGMALNGAIGQQLAGNGTVNGAVILNGGAILSPATNGTVGTLTINSGSLAVSGGTLVMDISSASHDQIVLTSSSLSLAGGTLQLNATGTLPYGAYTLITYPAGQLSSGAGSASSLSVVGFAQPGAVATLSDAVDGQIRLIISATANDNITWAGVGTDWDLLGTANWYLGGSTPWAFTNGDIVTFNDVGASYPAVSLKASVSPSAITVTSDTTAYEFDDGTGTGGGKISGTATLTKNGASTLTVNTVNDTAGRVVINGGTVQVNGSLGSGSISNNAELVFNQAASSVIPGALSGPGNITKSGSTTATVTLAADSPLFTGGVTINYGTLQLGNGGATGSLGTSAAITNNGILALNRAASYTLASPVQGSGALTQNAVGNVTLTASNSYTGTTTISAGKLVYGSANAHAGAGSISIATGATNDLGGYDLTVSSLTGSGGGRLVNDSGTATNLVTITGGGDTSIVIADNDGSGGKISIVKTGTGEQIFRGASSYTGNTVINAGTTATARSQSAAFGTGTIVLNGGTLHNFASTLANPVQVLTNSTISSDGNSYMSGPLTGTSNLTIYCYGTTASGQTITWNSGADLSGYFGTFTCTVDATTYGRFWRWGGTGGGANAAWNLQGNFNMTVQGGGYTILLGSLSGTNGTWLVGNTTTYIVGGRNENTAFSGNVSGTGSLVKTGTGTWTLDGTGYYVATNVANAAYVFSGSTVVSNGVLHLLNGANPTNSSSIQIKAGATLDVSGLGYEVFETNELDQVTNTYTVVTHRLDLSTNGNAQTLTGSGTLRGSVVAYPNSVINPGDGIGTLTVTTNVTLGGTLVMELNRTNSPATNDMLVVGGTLTGGGTLTVNNLGPALQGGDTFKLFSAPVSGFTATNLPVLTGSMYWTNKLAIDGTIAVVNPVATNPTNITFTVSGNTLTLTWPADHTGWTLQAQTNNLSSGLGTNWVNVPGTTTVNTYNTTVDPNQPTVFYRLKY